MRGSILVLCVLIVATGVVLIPPRVANLGGDVLTMTVWGQPFEDRLFRDLYARGFERLNPGVAIDYQRHSDLEAKYNAWHAKGYGPEVMRLRITTYHQMVARGMLEPLDALIADPRSGLSRAEMDAFPPQLLQALRVNGKLYALPEDTAQYGLYYNRAIFDAHNRERPDDRIEYPNAAWTWSDFRRAAKSLTKRDPAGAVLVSGFDVVIWEWPFMQFFLQAGGELWTPDGLTTTINSPAGVEALTFLADLVRDGSWKPYFSQMGGLGPNDRFQNGQVAMYLDGSWMAPAFELNAPGLDFAIAPPPTHTSRRNMGGSVLWGISSHAPRKDLGWRMLHWLVQEPQAAAYWDTLRVAPPANLAVIHSPAFRSTSGIADPSRPGAYVVPPMPESRYESRAAWMVELMTPEPATEGRGGLNGLAGFGNEPSAQAEESRILRLRGGLVPGRGILQARFERAYIPAGLYQGRLEQEISDMFREFLQQGAAADERLAQSLLDRAARNVHSHIDRDRAARGLPAVDRSVR
jgi:multiple sugar transport system substrate-binding protein